MAAGARPSGEIQAAGVALVPRSGEVGGMWRIEAVPLDLVGLLSLEQKGELVSGSYRLSNGRRGSVHGTHTGEGLSLEMIDSERGATATIEGRIEAGSGEMVGTWQARELAANRPSAGTWTGRLVSLEQLLDR